MRCKYNRGEGGLILDVEQKAKDMLKRFPELGKLPYKTVTLQPSQQYPKIVGTMIYIAITARPDVAYGAGKLSRGMHQPNKLHCDMLKDAVGYLRSTISLPLRTTLHSQAIENIFPVRRIEFRRYGAI